MPVIPTVLAGSTFTNGLSAHFRDGYSMDGLQSKWLPQVMDLGLPSTARQTPYAYYESAPYPQLNPRGGTVPFEGFASKNFTVYNYNYEKAVGYHEDDREDDQIQGLYERAQQCGRNWKTLHQRVFSEIVGNGTPTLTPASPVAPDGVGLFSALNGAGTARFGDTGGNIVVGTGMGSAALRAGIWAAMAKFQRFKNTKNQPLWDASLLEQGFTLVYSADSGVDEAVREAVTLGRTVSKESSTGAIAAIENTILISGRKLDLWSNPLLSGNNIAVFANGCPHKPIFEQSRMALRETPHTRDNDTHAALTGEEWVQWKSRHGYGLWLPYGVVQLTN